VLKELNLEAKRVCCYLHFAFSRQLVGSMAFVQTVAIAARRTPCAFQSASDRLFIIVSMHILRSCVTRSCGFGIAGLTSGFTPTVMP
jgi:hypothetical protein